MSNKSIFMTEIEIQRSHIRRIRKYSWIIKCISFLLLLLSIHLLNNSNIEDIYIVSIFIVAICGLFSGYILYANVSKFGGSV